MKSPATRGELFAAVGLLLTVAGSIAFYNHKIGRLEDSVDQRATLMAQRNRENDVLERRIAALEARCKR